jgi:hypothetical protein
MAKATSSRGGNRKTQAPEYSDTSLAASQIGNIEKRAHRASAARHARKCTVCHHKDREFIDDDYLRWLSPKKIAREYGISHQSVIYRHADATGLRAQRRASLRATLENFIEQAECVRATAGSVVAAVRLYAQINDQGQWTPPVRRHIVEHRYPDEPPGAARPGNVDAASKKTGSSPPVATIIAGSAMPFGESPEKFPAVPVASITLDTEGAAHSAAPPPKAPGNFSPATNHWPLATEIPNREHVELEHAPTN